MQAGGHRFEPVHLHHWFGVEAGFAGAACLPVGVSPLGGIVTEEKFRCAAKRAVGHLDRFGGLGCVGLWKCESGSGASLDACACSDGSRDLFVVARSMVAFV